MSEACGSPLRQTGSNMCVCGFPMEVHFGDRACVLCRDFGVATIATQRVLVEGSPVTRPMCDECVEQISAYIESKVPIVGHRREPFAREQAVAEGCPESLFVGLCDWIASVGELVDHDLPELRYAPNTRAQALAFWRWMRDMKEHVL